jgi:hypothetical protein
MKNMMSPGRRVTRAFLAKGKKKGSGASKEEEESY